jgi:methylmalonyl-CoA mutase N-terminal domain/subunit
MRERFKARRSAIVAAAIPLADRRRVADGAAALQQRRADGAAGDGAVLGGTQSLHTNSLDEALALPTEEAATLALRTQQIIAHETGVTNVVDPFGGSYFVEKLTTTRSEALDYFERIDRMGGMVEAIERGYPQREIAESSYRFQQAVESREKVIVGVNDFVAEDDDGIGILYIDEAAGEKQLARLESVRATRDRRRSRRRSTRCRPPRAGGNTMPLLLDAVRAYATIGEMCDALARLGRVRRTAGNL